MADTAGAGPRIFDAHFHIIDPRFPLVPNQGFLPEPYTVADYLAVAEPLGITGGAVVSGSFQAFDQGYLLAALKALGPGFVGVTQLPADTPDKEILRLDEAGVRAVRFNLRRGGSEDVSQLLPFAHRVHALAGWHVELYVDSRELSELAPVIRKLPSVSIDHLGLSHEGFDDLPALVGEGVRVKASGFGRVDFDPFEAIARLYAANPKAVMFGTDLPGTRAPRAFHENDLEGMSEVLGADGMERVLWGNAVALYRVNM